MESIKNKYYMRLNENNRIVKTFSTAFEKPEKNDILIGEGEGSQFRAGSDVLSEELQEFSEIENGLELINEHGLYCLKYEKGLITKVSEEDLQEEFNTLPKPQIVNLETLQKENIILMETTADLYELTLEQDNQIKGLKKENVEMMLALTEIYENVL